MNFRKSSKNLYCKIWTFEQGFFGIKMIQRGEDGEEEEENEKEKELELEEKDDVDNGDKEEEGGRGPGW